MILKQLREIAFNHGYMQTTLMTNQINNLLNISSPSTGSLKLSRRLAMAISLAGQAVNTFSQSS